MYSYDAAIAAQLFSAAEIAGAIERLAGAIAYDYRRQLRQRRPLLG
jgi:hypothetical protein